MRDHSTGRSRGFGFVTFESDQSVDDLLANGNRIEFAGTQVRRWSHACIVKRMIVDVRVNQTNIFLFKFINISWRHDKSSSIKFLYCLFRSSS